MEIPSGVAGVIYDNDGDLDIVVANTVNQSSTLYSNSGSPTYTLNKVSSFSSITGNHVGSSWGDYDNDGNLDLLIGLDGSNNILYKNSGAPNYSFLSVSEAPLTSDGGNSFGCSWVDIDNDGDLDALIANQLDQNNVLYENNGTSNHFLEMDLVGVGTNTSAIGAKIHIYDAPQGVQRHQFREVLAQSGYNSQVTRIHAGVQSSSSGFIDSVIVEWPSGIRQAITHIKANQILRVKESAIPFVFPFLPALRVDPVYAETIVQFAVPGYAHPRPTFSLVQNPSGMSIDDITGIVSWIPSFQNVGLNTIKVVADNLLGKDTITIQIEVLALELTKPTFPKVPDKHIFVESAYRDTFSASITAGTTYSMLSAPIGMTISYANGAVAWTPGPLQINETSLQFDVVFRASNSVGSDTLRYKITVHILPSIHVFQNPVRANYADVIINSSYPFLSNPAILNNGQTTNTKLIASTDRLYLGSMTFASAGSQTLQMSAMDSNRLTVTTTRQLTVAISKQRQATAMESPDKKIRLEIASPSMDGMFLIEENIEGGDRVYQIQGHATNSVLTWHGDHSLLQNQGSAWITLEGSGRANLTSLGQFKFGEAPKSFSLNQNYPNPFNPSTQISFQITRPGKVRLSIYNTLGQKIRDLIHEERSVGTYRVVWDGRNESGNYVSSGIYFYRLESAEGIAAKKMLLRK